MAHLFIFPQKDSTIFSKPTLLYQNSGRDEILEIEKTFQDLDAPGGNDLQDPNLPSLSRTLIRFDLASIADKMAKGTITNPKFVLNLKTVEAKQVPLAYTIEAFPVSQSWEMGVGRKYDEVTTQGVSWKFRDAAILNGELWYQTPTITETKVPENLVGCFNGTWSGFWKGSVFGYFNGILEGYISGSIASSSLDTYSYFETEDSSSVFFTENLSSYFGSVSLTTISGSFSGSFVGAFSGSFSGSAILNIQSSSIQYASSSTSLTDESGGGTWYVNPSASIRGGGCLGVVSSCVTWSMNMSSSLPYQYRATQSFNYETSDICMDVSNIVYAWLSGSMPNNGFILKHSDECGQTDYGQLRFFSMDSNTIYLPTLDCQWDDSIFNPTSSMVPLTDTNKVVYVSNIRPEYKSGTITRFDVFGRQKYPQRTFSRTSDYLVPQYLPSSSYYAVKDAESEEYWVGFDDYTKISCDTKGNYFVFNTVGLPEERYFKFVLKVEESGSIDYYEDSPIFKITR